MPKTVLPLAALAALLALPAPAAAAAAKDDDSLLKALVDELQRSQTNLKAKGDEPLYYLSYRVSDGRWFVDSASFGAIEDFSGGDESTAGRARRLYVAARVGSRQLDNTHKVRGSFGWGDRYYERTQLPIEDDLGALQIALWKETDRAYKGAAKQLIKVKANKRVKVEEEDNADDFSEEKPTVSLGKKASDTFDRKAWKEKLKRASALFKTHPLILNSQVSLQGGSWTHYFVDSEGSRVREPRFFVRIMIAATVKSEDGMDLELYDELDADRPEALPTEAQIETKVRDLIARIETLRTAPVVEPYSGPAIITNRAAAVFFHEIFGHRVEGHRQKDDDEGHTFTKKVGQRIVPEFISVVDDPTQKFFGKTPLNGAYQYDDEGVASQKVSLVESGVLKSFLMGRTPIAKFPKSNGHGRAQPGAEPVARQGNLLVQSAKQMPYADLRKQLIAEVQKRGKPYGLVFQEISGGFTMTRTGDLPQAFKVLPLIVHRVYADGRPDELVRGVDLVGTPLQSLENILATGDDYSVFNGFCGAESGFIPVSAVAPSLLLSEIEVERRAKGADRPPLLAPPLSAPAAATPVAKEVK
ncbi:MAG TPA: metallopeptidase TldD-related protein [Myxococcales bacterium]|jgi:predicted Zn-dependent protease